MFHPVQDYTAQSVLLPVLPIYQDYPRVAFLPAREDRAVQPAEVNALREFIQSLAPDWEGAGQRYETIRKSLLSYFRARKCGNPEELADEAIDRIARKHKEALDLPKFVRGVARRVASERFRIAKTVSIDAISEPHSKEMPDREIDVDAERLSKLAELLETLAQTDRDMLVAYYQFRGAAKIKNRQHLAASLNTSQAALAVRVLRVRKLLRNRWPDAVA